MAQLSIDSAGLYAEAMMRAIKVELPDAAYLTREDLLHLSCFMHVSTITRYRYVCLSVRYALDRKWLYTGSGFDLYVAGGRKAYAQAVTAGEEYERTVARLIPPKGTVFTVHSVLQRWESDHHLTDNSKRTYVRAILKRMLAREEIRAVEFNIYERV